MFVVIFDWLFSMLNINTLLKMLKFFCFKELKNESNNSVTETNKKVH